MIKKIMFGFVLGFFFGGNVFVARAADATEIFDDIGTIGDIISLFGGNEETTIDGEPIYDNYYDNNYYNNSNYGGGETVLYSQNLGSASSGTTVNLVQNFDALFQNVNGGTGVTPTGKFELPDPKKFNKIGENTSLRQYILNVLNFVLTFLGIIAVAMVIYAGYLYVISAGDDSNMEKAKKIIIYGAIGILVVLMSFAFVNTIIKKAGVGERDNMDANSWQSGSSSATGAQTVTLADGTVVSAGTITTADGSILDGNQTVGTITTADGGTVTLNSTGAQGADNTISSVFQNFQSANLITVAPAKPDDSETSETGGAPDKGLVDYGNVVIVTPQVGRNGIVFGLNLDDAQAIVDFDDRTQALIDTKNSGSGSNSNVGQKEVIHHFGSEGTYNIRAIIKTVDGKELTARKTMIVGGIDARYFASKTTLLVNEKITLDASSSTVAIGAIRDFRWDCEAKNPDQKSGCFSKTYGQKPTLYFEEPGLYDVKLEIENIIGATDQEIKTFTVLGERPVAKFTTETTNNSKKPGEYKFNARTSTGIRGDNQGLIYFWNFAGDLKQVNTPELVYEFTSTGTKKIELVIVENHNGLNLKSEPVKQTLNIKTTVPIDFDVE